MSEMILLSEYKQANRYAWVCRNQHNQFVAIGYEDNLERQSYPFNTESQAEDWCEDWVQNTSK